jgi:metal-responsive CopG/Arc/MetJ family transcriptional regulator
MPVKPIQISLDVELLERIDKDPEARERGRSALIRSAVEVYLKAKERKSIEKRIIEAYGGSEDDAAAEIQNLIGAQAWPDD